MKRAFLYSEKFGEFSYGPVHPMRPVRLKLTYELIKELGLLDVPGAELVEAGKAGDDEILLYHTPEYLKILKEADSGAMPDGGANHGLGFGDNPVFRGVFEWSAYSTGASIQAAELVAEGKFQRAFNIAGGLHHAMPDRASGFCYINDAAVCISRLVRLGKRVAYVDIDAHHGDGVEAAFRESKDVLTISIHESGAYLFPGTGFSRDTGAGPGRGFSVNLPLPPGAGDGIFVRAFEEIVPEFIEAFKPDILVTQLGVDTLKSDPITHLELTTNGFEEMVKRFRSFELPWVALGGGGYDMGNVARAWTIAWAVMNDIEPPERIPEPVMRRYGGIFGTDTLRDPVEGPGEGGLPDGVLRDIEYLKKEVLPLVRG